MNQTTETANGVHPLFNQLLAPWTPPAGASYSDEDIERIRTQEPLPPNRPLMLPASEQEEE